MLSAAEEGRPTDRTKFIQRGNTRNLPPREKRLSMPNQNKHNLHFPNQKRRSIQALVINVSRQGVGGKKRNTVAKGTYK